MNFDRFTEALGTATGPAADPWLPEALVESVAAYPGFAQRFAGRTFAKGLYRVHDGPSGFAAQKLVREMFPRFAARAVPFSFDWLGRQFAVDLGRRQHDGQPLVLMLEPGTGQALEVPSTFQDFHEVELVEYQEPALAVALYSTWVCAHPGVLQHDKCVGYKVPLFLGGSDDTTNLEEVDLQIYWSLCAQLLAGVGDLPPDTRVTGVHLE